MEADIQVQKLRLVGTVERLNRSAVAAGQNGKMKAAKGVIQMKRVGENHWQIWVSVAKDLDGQRYDVHHVQKMRTNFIQDGKLSIELRQPPFTLMLRDCKPSELILIANKINEVIRGGPRIKPLEKTNADASKDPGQIVLSSAGRSEAESRRSGVQKRPAAQMDMTKTEMTSIRKSLKMASGSLVVADRSEYPLRGFPSDLIRLTMQKLMLKKIDYRIQDLLHLKNLSLQENRIASIDALAFLKSHLEHLNVANNQIERISSDLFLSKAFSRLKILNLNNNQLRSFPHTLVELQDLKELSVANNQLEALPYNLHRLRCLLTLKINNNRLTWLPSPISMLSLNFLDISSNPFNSNALAQVQKKVGLSPSFPTLFELAASKLLSSVQKRDRYLSSLSEPSLMPRIIFDFFTHSKYCRSCGKMHCRYEISYQKSTNSLAQEFIRSFRDYPICRISCDVCSKT